MKLAIIFSLVIILLMIICIIKFPIIKIFNKDFQTFWIVPLIGVIFILVFNLLDIKTIFNGLTNNSSINPLKILILFFSMTFLSVILDELGFFEYLANYALKKAKSKQIILFIILYFLTSILTIFTSNDIIILTFTPFIIFFTKNAKINPIPYLVSEFVAANTWSMIFIIGNPTNIYLATSANINFIEYFKVMFLPTIFAGITAFLIIYLIFRKELNKEIQVEEKKVVIKNKFLLTCGVISLSLCTIILIISSYINIEMYLVALIFALIMLSILLGYFIINKKKDSPNYLLNCLKRISWSLAPFVLSMFVIVLMLEKYDITLKIANLFDNKYPILTYGVTSTLSCNLINNIPMSVLFSKVIPLNNNKALFSTIIGSNIGAFISPIGALAGIMWLSILKKYDINYGFGKFLKYGLIIACPTLLMALLGLSLIL